MRRFWNLFLLTVFLSPAPRVTGESIRVEDARPSRSLEALFDEAHTSWERSLPEEALPAVFLVWSLTGPSDRAVPSHRHILRQTRRDDQPLPTLFLGGPDRDGGPFALPRSPDLFVPLAPGPVPPNLTAREVLSIPADRYFRTDGEPILPPQPPPLLPGAKEREWVAVEARNPLLGNRTLMTLRQMGLASLTPVPEPALPSLVGLAVLGALFRRRRSSQS